MDDAKRIAWDYYNPRCVPLWDCNRPNEAKDFERKFHEQYDKLNGHGEFGYLTKVNNKGGFDAIKITPKTKDKPVEVQATQLDWPISDLGEVLEQFVTEASDQFGVPKNMVATPLLAALAGAIGTTKVLRVDSNWFEPAIIWSLVVAPPGAKKSSVFGCIRQFFDPAKKIAKENFLQGIPIAPPLLACDCQR